jgi:TRAP-type C4-dicarboxylate transport system substrate-binding protein
MKKLLLASFALVIIFSLVLAGCSSTPTSTQTSAPATQTSSQAPTQTSSQTINMRFANFFPIAALQGSVWDDFSKEIGTRTNGKVNITYYPGGSLIDATSMADSVENGVVEMGYISTAYFVGRYPVTDVLGMPYGFQSPYIGCHVVYDFINKYKPAEFDQHNLVVLDAGYAGGQDLWSTKKVTKLEDMKGLKIRLAGVGATLGTLWGAVPNGMAAAEEYDALKKGVIDAVAMPPEGAMTWKLGEAIQYGIQTYSIIPAVPMLICMNKDTWNNLPSDVQATFTSTASDWEEKWCLAWNQGEVDGVKYLDNNNIEWVDLSADELARWEQVGAPVVDSYYNEELKPLGYSQDDLAGFESFIKQSRDNWFNKQKAEGIKSGLDPALK